MRSAAGVELSVTRSTRTGLVTFLSAPRGRSIPVPEAMALTPEARALSFVDAYGEAFGLRSRRDVALSRTERDALGIDHVRMRQVRSGIPVTGGDLIVHMRGNQVLSANGKTLGNLDGVNLEPTVTSPAALEIARQLATRRFNAPEAQLSEPRLEILNQGLLGGREFPTRLAWFIEARDTGLREFIWIDARSGTLLLNFSQLTGAKDRAIYNGNNTFALPGTLMRSEGGVATGDVDADKAYDYAGDTYDYFFIGHGRDSFDGTGGQLKSTVHHCPSGGPCPYPNAFWNGTQMVYGNGFASADDVVAHELTHAVTERTANLFYYMQSGALNESFSDIFGEAVDLGNAAGTDTAGVRWQLGEDLGAGAIRNMMTPTLFSDPGKMSDAQFACELSPVGQDSGGVHTNSGVPNHAFALMVDGGTYNGISVAALDPDPASALAKAGKIQYRALTEYLTSASDFLDNYSALQQACSDLIGTAGIAADSCVEVKKALDAVQMSNTWPCASSFGANAATPALCPAGQHNVDTFFDGFESGLSNWTISGTTGTWFRTSNPLNPLGGTEYATSGIDSLWGYNKPSLSDSRIGLASNVAIPSGARLQFNHSYGFENSAAYNWDGGLVEYSVDGGSVWTSLSGLYAAGANYGGNIYTGGGNPLGGQPAFVKDSFGYTASQYNLAGLSGQTAVRVRFRIGTDPSVDDYGWFIDDFRIYQCVADPPIIQVAAGDHQTATAGTAVATAPSVIVRDAFSNPVSGVAVTFSVALGGGSVTGGTQTTDGSGTATVGSWTLGTVAGTNNNTLTATSDGLTGSPVTFTASALAGVATQIAISAGNNQTAIAGSALATSPSILVRDENNNPVPGVSVTFAVALGGGSVTGGAQTTDSLGLATVGSWTLGTAAGVSNNTLTATSTGLTGSPVTFTASALAGAATQIAIHAGNNQSSTAGGGVAILPSVTVRDTWGNPVSGAPVTFAVGVGGGSVTGGSQSTDSSGIATVGSWTLGTTAGTNNNTLTATSSGLIGSPVTFTASALAGAATQIAIHAGNNQTATVGSAVAILPSVIVKDTHGNPASGVSVEFAVASGGGSVTGASQITNASGVATAGSWTLGTTAGTNNNTLTATSGTLAGSPVTFTASASTGIATQIAINAGDNQTATAGSVVGTAPSVIVRDESSNPVSGVLVTFSVASGGGSVSGGTQTTNGSGIATVGSWTLGPTAGTNNNTLTATSGTLAGSPITFTASAVAGVAAQLAIAAGNNQTATAGSAVATPPSVVVRDANNNPVSGVPVTFTVASGGGSLTGGAQITDSLGLATVGSWTLGTTAGTDNNTLLATSFGLVGSPVTFTASTTSGAATQMAVNAGDNQTATAGTPVAIPPSVLVRDAHGNPVSGAPVTFAVASGGGSLSSGAQSTDALGIATVGSWTLGTAAGIDNNTLTATSSGLAGSPITFTASASAGAATQMAINAGDNQTATAGSAVATPPSVIVRDAISNPVSGVSVTFAVASGGGGIIGETQMTNASGIATVGSWTLGTTAGTNNNSITATSPDLIGSPLTFTASATAGAATEVAINAGNDQTATVGSAVATLPSVIVRDANSNPVPGVSVLFEVATGGGSLVGGAQITDASGVATVASWTLGTTAGTNNNSITATSPGLAGSPLTFTASATAGAATQVSINAGNNQTATVGSSVATPPSVVVRDGNSNPVSGVSVTFEVATGGGSVIGGAQITDASGVATVGSWTLGPMAGTNNNTLTGTSLGLTGSPLTFTASATAGAAAQVAINAGNNQTATVGMVVALAPSVIVRDGNSNPVSGVSVTFELATGGGSLTDGLQITNAAGVATVGSWTLGTTAGTNNNSITATAPGLIGSPLTFTASATAGAATQVAINAGNNQTATVGSAVTTPPSVIVRDANNNPVSGVSVTFAVATGGGAVTGGGPTTNALGIATAGGWTLGITAGANNNTLTATATGLIGSPVIFTASAAAGAAARIAAGGGDNQTVTAGSAVPIPPWVIVRDIHGNPVSGAPVSFEVIAGGGSLIGGSQTTDAAGMATVGSWTLGTTAGSNNNTLTAIATGLIGSPVTFTASATAGVATQMAIVAGNNETATAGSPVATPPSVIVRDSNSNPVSGVSVTFAVATGGGGVAGAVQLTNASGLATVGSWTLGTIAGANNNTLTASAAGLAGSPITFTASATPGAAMQIAVSAGNGQMAPPGNAVPIPPSVIVRDVYGNPVSGVPVVFAVASGEGSVTGGSQTTNASGIATVGGWTLGTTPADNTLTAASSGLVGSPVTFTASVAWPSMLDPIVTQVAAGLYHACALTTAGGVNCWGWNGNGQLGDGTTTSSTTPVGVSGLASGVASIAAGQNYACALTMGGAVKCWGLNDFGQLGDGTTTNAITPVAVSGLASGVVSISAGLWQTCALTTAGGVKCWGRNLEGQLGNGTTNGSTTPVDVVGLSSGVASISAGVVHTCAVTAVGGLKCWGDNSSGALGDGTTSPLGAGRTTPGDVLGLTSGVASVSAGSYYTCAVTAEGGAKCWGENNAGQVGDGTTASPRTTPVDVSGLMTGVKGISAGGYHTCAVMIGGEAKCWGSNQYGGLGDGTENHSPTPVTVSGLTSGVATISVGSFHSACVTTVEGGVRCWGNNDAGQLGNGTATGASTAVDVSSHASGVASISTGAYHTCALTTGAGAKCWGNNNDGQLGDGTAASRTIPVQVLDLPGRVTSISEGWGHTCALTAGGGVKCWGDNDHGQLGDGTSSTRVVAVDVLGLTSGVAAISAGERHTCALMASGGVKCWGSNGSGQLGDGTGVDRDTAVDVLGLTSGATMISAGGNHTCALMTLGGVKCWGSNNSGQLGDGTTSDQASAVDVLGLPSDVASLSAGYNHTCAVTTGGGVKCWGYNYYPVTTIVDVAGLTSGVAGLASAYGYSCALTSAGGIKCWGNNSWGQLGDGTTSYRSGPVDVLGLTSGVASIAAGWSHTCAVTIAGGVECWGNNNSGQLGDGTMTDRLTAVLVRPGQSIAFSPPDGLTVGVATALAATSLSELPVMYDTWTPGTCSVTGNSVTATAAALCGIRASQLGGPNRAPSPQELRVIAVAAVPPTVTTASSAVTGPWSATLGGNVTADGGTAVTGRGIVYAATAANADPELGGSGVVQASTGGATGVFAVDVLGLSPATGYSFKAYAINGAGTSYTSLATFTTRPPPSQIAIDAGDSQTAIAGSAVATAPSVRVRDVLGDPVAGVSVTFAVAAGGGTITGGTQITNASGIATVGSWTLGTSAGTSNNILTAMSSGLAGSPITFTASAVAGPATQVAINGGNNQTATAGSAVTTPPSVIVRDANGNPVAGVAVTFAVASGGGSLTGGTPTTNASGIAAVESWMLGGAAGTNNNTLTATSGVLAGSPVTFTASASAGAATLIAINAGNNQTATAGTAVATAPSVIVRDVNNNPVSGVSVTFAVATGGGSLTGGTQTTNASGIATVGSWTLGTTAGTNNNTLTATSTGLAGSPLVFTASASAGAATQIAINAGNNQAATAGTSVPTAPSVIVRDVNNNPVSGVSVTFAVATGGGSLTDGTQTTNASGIATVGSWTLGTTAGTNNNTLIATSTGLAGSPVTFTASATAGAATQIAINAGNNQTATAGTAVATAPSAIVRDVNNNPVSGVSVTFAVATGGGSVTSGTQITNASGIATVGSWTLGTTAGTNNNNLTATSTGLVGSPVTFTASATAGAATQIAINAGDNQTATAGTAVATAPSVIVRDVNNNPVSGVSVTFAVATGGGSATGGTQTTNASGIATVGSWTLGTIAGTNNNTLTATSAGLAGSPLTFTATAVAGAPTHIVISGGNNQTATVGSAVATPPSVTVHDVHGNPVSGVSVIFAVESGGGSVTGETQDTNASGIATLGSWTLGTTAGTNNNTLTATSAGLAGSPLTFTATAVAGAPTQIALGGGNNQTATAGTVVATPPSVMVRDVHGNPASGVSVTFAVESGGGSVTGETQDTNASGIATVGSWTLGTTAGTNNNTLTATSGGLAGSPITFTASATAGAAAQVAINAGNNQTATVGSAVATPPSVIVRDAHSNPVSGVSVTFEVATGGGSLTDGLQVTNAAGMATVGSWTLGTTAGTDNNTLTAAAAGLAGSPITFTASAIGSPTVATPTSALIAATTATLGGDVTSDGGSAITERGVVYSQTAANDDPLIGGAGVIKVAVLGETGLFSAGVTGLSPTTSHSFKAFATNAIGTSYTSVATFITTCPTITLGSLPNGNVNAVYTASAAASGGTGPYTYAVTSESLPGGLSLTTSGEGAGNVFGTPTTTGTFTFDITATDTSGVGTCTGVRSYSVVIDTELGQDFFTLTPCRVFDTRSAAGPLGGPALVAQTDRTFVVAGACGIPADAKAISVNLAVTGPTVAGNIRLHPGGTPVPLVSSINFKAGQTRSNNAVIPLSALGELGAYLDQVSGTAHLILDVNGYFK